VWAELCGFAEVGLAKSGLKRNSSKNKNKNLAKRDRWWSETGIEPRGEGFGVRVVINRAGEFSLPKRIYFHYYVKSNWLLL
jgi:hypothetical protein